MMLSKIFVQAVVML